MNTAETGESFIKHYGVLGMKWGVRRDRSQLRTARRERKSSTEAKRAKEVLAKAKRSGVSSLTNKELGDLNKRLELEQRFSQVSTRNTRYRVGMGFAKEVLNVGNMGSQAYSLATSPAAKAVQEALNRTKRG